MLIYFLGDLQVLRDMLKSSLQEFDQHAATWAAAVAALSEMDCLLSLLVVKCSMGQPICRPTFSVEPGVFDVRNLRHPCLVSTGCASLLLLAKQKNAKQKTQFFCCCWFVLGLSPIIFQTIRCLVALLPV